MPSAGDVRAVVDTNVLLSGLFWRGKPHAVIEQVRAGALSLISSPGLLAELAEVMNRPKFEEILAAVSRDPSDDAVLALAVASQADLIITGDNDLLILGSHAGIAIIDPAEAVTRIGRQTG